MRRGSAVTTVAVVDPEPEDELHALPPPEVVELARSGRRLEAIRRYRELTGATPEEARAVVGAL